MSSKSTTLFLPSFSDYLRRILWVNLKLNPIFLDKSRIGMMDLRDPYANQGDQDNDVKLLSPLCPFLPPLVMLMLFAHKIPFSLSLPVARLRLDPHLLAPPDKRDCSSFKYPQYFQSSLLLRNLPSSLLMQVSLGKSNKSPSWSPIICESSLTSSVHCSQTNITWQVLATTVSRKEDKAPGMTSRSCLLLVAGNWMAFA